MKITHIRYVTGYVKLTLTGYWMGCPFEAVVDGRPLAVDGRNRLLCVGRVAHCAPAALTPLLLDWLKKPVVQKEFRRYLYAYGLARHGFVNRVIPFG